MIEPYWGEFLISPVPLEMSLDYCSHKCSYCFANLNQPGRKVDTNRIMRFLQDYRERDTLEAMLLQQGYPVVISNRSDPFAQVNYRQSLAIMQVMVELGIPMQIQTKGGPGALEAVKMLPPSVWYISISTLDDDIRRKIEPGAPDIASRFELMEAAVEAGHNVILGFNPCVPEWQPDPEPLLRRAQLSGARGAWIEELHLSANQIRNLSAREYKAIGEDLIKRATLRRKAKEDEDAFFRAREWAEDLGFYVFSNGQPTYSLIWDLYKEVYLKTFPTMQDFVNLCHTAQLDWQILPVELWVDYMGQSLPAGRFRMSKYIGSSSRSVFEQYDIPSQLTYKELLQVIWKVRRTKQSPARLPAFAYAALRAQNGWIGLVDEQQNPYLVFDRAGEFTEYYTEVVPEWPVEQGGE